MFVEATAPTRIDFAGGTLDIFPIYVILDGAVTVNSAISLRTRVRIEPRNDKKIEIFSKDLNKKELIEDFKKIELNGNLDLIKNVVRNFGIESGLNIETNSDAPEGSGLAASSAMVIALVGALNELCKRNLNKYQMLDLGLHSELQMLRYPGGKPSQDYFSSIEGGFNAIWYKHDRIEVERLKLSNNFLTELKSNMILAYVGKSHFSAETNWKMFKNFIEKNPVTVQAMTNIKNVALKMREALSNETIEEIPKLLNEEMKNRRNLAEEVESQEVREVLNGAMAAGALGGKVCGAGGGGCVIIFAQKTTRENVIMSINSAGGKVLDFEFVDKGVEIIKG